MLSLREDYVQQGKEKHILFVRIRLEAERASHTEIAYRMPHMEKKNVKQKRTGIILLIALNWLWTFLQVKNLGWDEEENSTE